MIPSTLKYTSSSSREASALIHVVENEDEDTEMILHAQDLE